MGNPDTQVSDILIVETAKLILYTSQQLQLDISFLSPVSHGIFTIISGIANAFLYVKQYLDHSILGEFLYWVTGLASAFLILKKIAENGNGWILLLTTISFLGGC